jgi:hypothetical protein
MRMITGSLYTLAVLSIHLIPSPSTATPPTVSSIYPTLGPAGQWVYVHGSGFVAGSTTISVGGISNIDAHVYADSQLGFTLPDGASGTTFVSVTTPNGTATSAQQYTVGIPTSPPAVSRISPTLGPAGQWVYVFGDNFVFDHTTAAVGGVSNIPAYVYGSDQLGFTVPENAEGMTHIEIFTPFGNAKSSEKYQVGIPTEPPAIYHVNEYQGFNWVYVSGLNFVNGQTFIQVGSSYNTSGLVYSPTSLGFTPPTDWYDLNVLVVTTPFGSATQIMESASTPIPLSTQTQQNRLYQIQSSSDLLQQWQNVGDPIEGDGTTIEKELRARDKSHFWRVIEIE